MRQNTNKSLLILLILSSHAKMNAALSADISFNDLHVLVKSHHKALDATNPVCSSAKVSSIRTSVLNLGSQVGSLCQSFLSVPLDNSQGEKFFENLSSEKDDIEQHMTSIFLCLLDVSNKCNLNLSSCILKKMDLNERKYPVDLCKGKSGKYTAYSNHTGITKTHGQQTNTDIHETTISLTEMIHKIRKFATDRQWSKFHTPRNIVLALMGEIGELAEIFQWKGDRLDDNIGSWNETLTDHVGQELADCSIYLIRLSDVCSVDLAGSVLRIHGKGL